MCKENNNRLIKSQERLTKAQEKKAEFNAVILQSLSNLQKQRQLRICHGKEESNNGAYGNRSRSGYKLDRDDIVIRGRWLDTPDMRGSVHGSLF